VRALNLLFAFVTFCCSLLLLRERGVEQTHIFILGCGASSILACRRVVALSAHGAARKSFRKWRFFRFFRHCFFPHLFALSPCLPRPLPRARVHLSARRAARAPVLSGAHWCERVCVVRARVWCLRVALKHGLLDWARPRCAVASALPLLHTRTALGRCTRAVHMIAFERLQGRLRRASLHFVVSRALRAPHATSASPAALECASVCALRSRTMLCARSCRCRSPSTFARHPLFLLFLLPSFACARHPTHAIAHIAHASHAPSWCLTVCQVSYRFSLSVLSKAADSPQTVKSAPRLDVATTVSDN
jgi:hypothetical protein